MYGAAGNHVEGRDGQNWVVHDGPEWDGTVKDDMGRA